jgi:integrase
VAKTVFTVKWLKALKPAPAGTRPVHWDAALTSFGVRVTDRGAATFVVWRRIGKSGASVPIRIGAPWTVPLPRRDDDRLPFDLAKARDEARGVIADMSAGIDPRAKREAEVKEAEQRSERVFGKVAERFIAEYASKLKSGLEVAAAIRREFKPLWDEPIADVTADDLSDIVKAIAKDRPYAARHALAYVRKMFRWAIGQRSYKLKESPCRGLSPAEMIGKPMRRKRVLKGAEQAAIWRATAPDGPLGVPLSPFVRMLFLTGQRLREVGEAQWSEFDLDQALWTIPAERMKGDAAHEVPLVPAVVDLLKALPRGVGPFVFSTTDGRRPISGFSKLKARLDKKLTDVEPWRFHDIRRTMRTGLGGLPVPRNVAELTIAHAQPDLDKVYDQHAYRDEKRQALELWTKRLLSTAEPPQGDNVLPFPARA